MNRSTNPRQLNKFQTRFSPCLVELGFRKRGRTYNRVTSDGLIQVVNLQAGTKSCYGRFAINLGVYVPEVAQHFMGLEEQSFPQDYHCCVRERLGALVLDVGEKWWELHDEAEFDNAIRYHETLGFPWLAQFENRDMILQYLNSRQDQALLGGPPRIICAVIHTIRGERDKARALLERQSQENHNPQHPAFVRELCEKLGLGKID